MKKPSKNSLRSFIIGVLVGFLAFFIIDLIFNWDQNASDFQEGRDAAKNKFESTN
ncbi:MAG: hypothetical protein HPY60_11460 [Candidatus Methanofastidiosum sp.]|nr:hypothetical protein [Methanofastidiosum sp.]